MSCKTCTSGVKCAIHSAELNGKNIAQGSGPCSSPNDDQQGFVRYLKKCFQWHFHGSSTKRHKSKVRKVESDGGTLSSDPVESSSLEELEGPPIEDKRRDNKCEFDEKSKPPHHSLAVELLKLSKFSWYWGPITQAEAEEKLRDQPDGSFLVRDSYADHYLVTMSFCSLGKIYHTRINHCNGYFSLYQNPSQSCTSIQQLIELSMNSSKSSVYCYLRPRCPASPMLPVRLTRPLSRFTEVHSLQHLCRFVIRQNTRVDQIKNLPLPASLCGYVQAKKF